MISFDIETSITDAQEIVIAGIAHDHNSSIETEYFHSGPGNLATRNTLCACVARLVELSDKSPIVTWNGTGFVFRLAQLGRGVSGRSALHSCFRGAGLRLSEVA